VKSLPSVSLYRYGENQGSECSYRGVTMIATTIGVTSARYFSLRQF
jgi:hypothetical protein